MILTVVNAKGVKPKTKGSYLFGRFSFIHPKSILGIRTVLFGENRLNSAYVVRDELSASRAIGAGVLTSLITDSMLLGIAIAWQFAKPKTHLLLIFDTGEEVLVATSRPNAEKILQKAKYTGVL